MAQKFQTVVNAFEILLFAGNTDALAGLGTGGNKYGTVSFTEQVVKCVFGINGRIVADFNPPILNLFNLFLDHLTRQPEFWYRNTEHAACDGLGFENGGLVAHFGKIICAS